MASLEFDRNQPSPLDLGYVYETRVNPSATQRRAATLGKRRSIKKEWQAAWLLRAVTCIDLTTLAGDDTPGKVHRMCAKAKQPIRQELPRFWNHLFQPAASVRCQTTNFFLGCKELVAVPRLVEPP